MKETILEKAMVCRKKIDGGYMDAVAET